MAPSADYCPIAVGVEVGDRWTPLVIRERKWQRKLPWHSQSPCGSY